MSINRWSSFTVKPGFAGLARTMQTLSSSAGRAFIAQRVSCRSYAGSGFLSRPSCSAAPPDRTVRAHAASLDDNLETSSTATAASSSHSPIYSRPDMYDAAFSYRNYKSEVKFLMDCYKRHASSGQPPGTPVQSVLELGCGPARHLLGFSKAGLPVVVGLDASDDMLAYAQSLAAAAPPAPSGKGKGNNNKAPTTVQLVKGDMASFDLPQKDLDMVICLLGTVSAKT